MGAHWALATTSSSHERSRTEQFLRAVIVAPPVTQAVIQLTWWGFFRWAQRKPPGDASLWGLGLVRLSMLAMVLHARRHGAGIPMAVTLPRMVAASLFFALLVTTAPTDGPLWMHTAAIAVPYLAASQFKRAV